MQNRNVGFAAMLAVMVVSALFGVFLGTKLSAPPVALAAVAGPALQLATPREMDSGAAGLADIVERSLPAVVSVTAISRVAEGGDPHEGFLGDQFRFFFYGEPPDGEDHRGPSPRRVGSGSGFVISPDGYVLTNNHVIENSEKVEVMTNDGHKYRADIVGTDVAVDLALLKIEPGRELPTLPLGNSDRLRVGEWVIAIGNPLDFDHTVTVGVVSGKERQVTVPSTDNGIASFIQTDAAINLGNSGGPLLDARGNVIGINTAIRRQNFAEGMGFALPINTARDVVEQLRKFGEVRRGYIGIVMNDTAIDDTIRDYYSLPDTRGVLVKMIKKESPAGRAGLRDGDVVRAVDGQPVRDNQELISRVSSRQPGDQVRLEVLRRSRPLEFTVTLADREDELRAEMGLEPPRAPRREPEKPAASRELGLTVESVDDTTREDLELPEEVKGVVVTDVDFQSEADTKGMQPTMVITAVNDEPIRDVSAWSRAIERMESGAPVKLDVTDGKSVYYFFLRVPGERD